MRPKSPEQVRKELRSQGKTLASVARELGFKPRDVYLVMAGTVKGHYGNGHRIAVALGLKAGD